MKLLFVGDVMLGRLVNEVLKTEPPEYIFGDTLPIFKDADWRACNLECVLSDKGEPFSQKAFHFRSDAKNVKSLATAEINFISLANNHSLDFGHEAMLDMIKILNKVRIDHAGAGRNYREALKPAIMELPNREKIGVIAFTDNEPDWEAKEFQPGISYLPVDLEDERAEEMFDTIRETKKKVDILVVSAHWGPNWGDRPPGHHLPFGRGLIEAGADIVFGHSSHVFRGVEVYKGRPIIYGAGDFIDDYAVDPIARNDQSFIYVVEMEKNIIKDMFLYPVLIRDFQARLARGEEARETVLKMKTLCLEFGVVIKWNLRENRLEIH